LRDERNQTDIDPFLQNLQTRWSSLNHPRVSEISLLNHPGHSSPSKLIPLDQCIWMILREAFDVTWQNPTDAFAYNDLVLFRAAALYQAKTDTVSSFFRKHLRSNKTIGSTDLPIFDMPTRLPRTYDYERAQPP
jgi:hypothetical protein